MTETTFSAIFNQVKTTVDGGWRVTLDVPRHESKAMSELAGMREQVLQVAVVISGDIADDSLE